MIKRLLYILLAIIILLVIYGFWTYSSLKPDYNEKTTIPGLHSTVNVYYDEYAIPHIYADSLVDAYLALGYVHAKERLWQMEILKRIGPGRLSEIFGEATLDNDRFFRSTAMEAYSKAAAKRFKENGDPKVRQLVDAYIQGVNQYISHGSSPIEFRILNLEISPFTLEDIFYISDYMAFSFAMAHKTEPILDYILQVYGSAYLNDLDVHVDPSTEIIRSASGVIDLSALSFHVDDILDQLPAPAFIGSNSWVLGPTKTATGEVLFANDPHIGFSQPAVWFEAHIEAPGVSLYGNYLSGYPFPHLGHSDHHAIGLTMFENDDIDLFREKVNPENPDEYLYNGEWLTFEKQTTEIAVRDSEPVTVTSKQSIHGPVISTSTPGLDSTESVSMWWVYFQFPNDLLEISYHLMFASDMSEARKGASMIHGPGLNVMYGDKDGNIAWWAAAKLPKRPESVNSKLILDGSTSSDEVTGYFDFSQNPQAENPPWGYVYSANNQSISEDSMLHPGYYLPEDRARRIVRLLESRDDWDVNGTKAMLLDVTSENVPEIIDLVVNVMDTDEMSESARSWVRKLDDWDGEFSKNSSEAVVYTKFLYHLFAFGMEDELSARFDLFNGTHVMKRSVQALVMKPNSPWWDDIGTNVSEDLGDIANKALETTLGELTTQLGADQTAWKWSAVHVLEHGHALGANATLKPYFDIGPFGVSGTTEVINNLQFQLNNSGIYQVFAGPSCRRIVDFSDVRNNSWSILPTGQSGRVLSPHYKDQALMYANGQFRKKLMSQDVIKEKARYQSVFTPQ